MLYFIEGEKAIREGLLKEHGLDRLIDNPIHREHMNGPGGKAGLVIKDGSFTETRELRFVDSEQTWSPRFGFDGTWVGFWDESTPTPDQLARPNQVDGPDIELLDGNRWKVPVLREWREESNGVAFDCCLPSVLQQSPETGELVPGRVVGNYRDLWNESCEIADEILRQMKDGSAFLDSSRLDRFVGDLLATNYRISLGEIGLLGLLDERLYLEVLYAALDWTQMMDLAKNLQSRLEEAGGDSPNIDSTFGATQRTEASKPITAPPSES